MQNETIRLQRFIVWMILIWTVAVGASLVWNISHSIQTARNEALQQAEITFKMDMTFRRWNASHGGVYVPVDKNTPPNKYLKVPERDIATPSGKRLTLMNPAYMVRQVFEGENKVINGIQRKITSLKVLNPRNAPDEWEKKALRKFETHPVKHVTMFSEIDGRKYLRHMNPLEVEEACLKCHESQGYKVGDIRGGISVSVPMEHFDRISRNTIAIIILCHMLLWTLGFAGIIIGGRNLIKAITERHKAEHSLRMTQFAVDNASDAVFWVKEDGSLVYFNKEALRRLEYTEDEMRQLTVFDFNKKEFKENWPDIWKNYQNGETVVVRRTHVARSGREIPTEITANMLVYDGVEYICVFAKDISRRLENEIARDALQDQLMQSQKMQAIGLLAGGMAHDFNNMLGIIMGAAQIIESRLDSTDISVEELGIIKSVVSRAKALTTKLLIFSREEQIELKPVLIGPLIIDVAELLKRSVPKQINLKIECDEGLPAVMADAVQIEQALINICNNAVDAMSGAGELNISVKSALVESVCKRNESHESGIMCCVITISDTGHGMPRDVADRVFDPFFTTKEAGKGTGLGLSVTHGIIKRHKGEIFISSEVGKGTTITIGLPFADGRQAAPEAKTGKTSLRGSETILLVDDEPLISRVTAGLLEKMGYKTIAVNSGLAALEEMDKRKEDIALVLVDYNMPEMNGLQILEKIRQIHGEIKCLMMSGFLEDNISETVQCKYSCGFIEKPFEVEDLCEKVRNILDQI